MEKWDAYDKDGRMLEGVTLIRDEPIPEGMYHIVCEIIVKHTDGSYLLMQRDPSKKFGGMWEASAGGSVLQGESAPEGARRELFEETGIRSDSLKEIGRVIKNDSLYVDYFCLTDCPKDSVVLQEGETVNYRWVSREQLVSMPKTELLTYRIQQFVEELK